MTDRAKTKPQRRKPVTAAAKMPPENAADAAQNPEIAADGDAQQAQMTPETAKQLASLRASVRENFGKAAMAMMMLPRYRHQNIGDLQHLVLEPLLRDRLAMAFPGGSGKETDAAAPREMLGFAIWASVSPEVDARIREQIKAGGFPVKLKPEDWTSGDINWLFDVIAPDEKSTISVIANFRQVAKEGPLVMHPVITRLVDRETLEKMGAVKTDGKDATGGKKPAGAKGAAVN